MKKIFFLVLFTISLIGCAGQEQSNPTDPPPPVDSAQISPQPSQGEMSTLMAAALTVDEIDTIRNKKEYTTDLLVLEDSTLEGIKTFRGEYQPSTGAGTVQIELYTITDENAAIDAEAYNIYMKGAVSDAFSGEDLPFIDGIELPLDFWSMKTAQDNSVHAGFSWGSTYVHISYQIPVGMDIDEAAEFAHRITEKQFFKLQNLGFERF